MDYIKQISTGKILESGTNEKSTMIQNAVNAGIDKDDIEFGQTDFATMSKWLEEQDWASKTYAEKRKTDYPDIGDQLDMLWHAIDAGTLDKTSDFYTSLKATKDKYPKT